MNKNNFVFLGIILLSFDLTITKYTHYNHHHQGHYNDYIHPRDLEDSLMDSISKHVKNVVKSSKEMLHNHVKNKTTGSVISSSNGGNSTVIKIENGHKITKTYKDGKLVDTKKEKVKDHGNSINIVNGSEGKNIVSIKGGSKHVTKDKNGNLSLIHI